MNASRITALRLLSSDSSLTRKDAQGAIEEQEYRVTYRNRFPIQPKRADGSWGCRGCGGVIPKGRRSWCSKACCKLWHPTFVIIEVKKRDKDVCASCGLDCRKAFNEWFKERGTFNYSNWKWSNPRPPKAEYDHIIPFSEGGLTVLENMRTLCSDCHKKRTRNWHRERKKNPAEAELSL